MIFIDNFFALNINKINYWFRIIIFIYLNPFWVDSFLMLKN